jgi:hypothetical protein
MKMNNVEDYRSRNPADWHLANTSKARDIISTIIAKVKDEYRCTPDNIKCGTVAERQEAASKIVEYIDLFTDCYYKLNAPPGYNSPEFKRAYRDMLDKLFALT